MSKKKKVQHRLKNKHFWLSTIYRKPKIRKMFFQKIRNKNLAILLVTFLGMSLRDPFNQKLQGFSFRAAESPGSGFFL